MFANSSADVSKYVGKTITHYYGGWRRPDIYTLDNLRFTEENIPGGTNNNPNNPNPTKPFKPCYLAGSLIRTPRGDVPVETLKEGDTVLTYQNGKAEEHPLRWVGKKHLYVRPNAHNGFVDYPVCIKKDALADGVPSQDLFVTPEHCMFLNGMFIPVRMLVNGVSIAYQEDVTEYDIYHIETEEHAVVWANDALSETYLDTGSRKMFNVVAQINAHSSELSEQYVKTWERDAAAPLETSRNVVEPVWQEIAQRAGVHYSTPATVNDPDLHLVTEAGDVIRPYRVRNDHYLFHLPENIDQVQLISRTARPSEVIGPFVDDRRNLGVLIDDIRLFQRTDYTEIEAPFHDASLPGWDVMEESHCRWTNGAALLPVERSAVSRVLSVHILQAGPYLASTEGKEGPFQDTVSASLLRA
nr:Hint domain-containing protein [Saccharibacter sp. 17.LH.SD]